MKLLSKLSIVYLALLIFTSNVWAFNFVNKVSFPGIYANYYTMPEYLNQYNAIGVDGGQACGPTSLVAIYESLFGSGFKPISPYMQGYLPSPELNINQKIGYVANRVHTGHANWFGLGFTGYGDLGTNPSDMFWSGIMPDTSIASNFTGGFSAGYTYSTFGVGVNAQWYQLMTDYNYQSIVLVGLYNESCINTLGFWSCIYLPKGAHYMPSTGYIYGQINFENLDGTHSFPTSISKLDSGLCVESQTYMVGYTPVTVCTKARVLPLFATSLNKLDNYGSTAFIYGTFWSVFYNF